MVLQRPSISADASACCKSSLTLVWPWPWDCMTLMAGSCHLLCCVHKFGCDPTNRSGDMGS